MGDGRGCRKLPGRRGSISAACDICIGWAMVPHQSEIRRDALIFCKEQRPNRILTGSTM